MSRIVHCNRSLVFVLACLVQVSASALLFTVNTQEDLPDANPGDGLALTSAGTTSLRAAIEEANLNPGEDYITFSAGLYHTEIGTALVYIEQPLGISDDLIISDEGRGEVYCRARGPGQFRPLEIAPGVNLNMQRVHWNQGNATEPIAFAPRGGVMYIGAGAQVRLRGGASGGTASEAGGAIYVDHATLYLAGAGVRGKSLGDGGGIYNDGGLIYATGAVIGGSADADGGGIYNAGGVIVAGTGRNGIIFMNGHAAGYGGGIYSHGGFISVRIAEFMRNEAFKGGMLYLTGGGEAEISGASSHDNIASDKGGAAYVDSGILRFSMSTLLRSTAGASGGALYVAGGAATLINVTIGQNAAGTEWAGTGGGIFVEDHANAACRLGNTLIATNVALPGEAGADVWGSFQSLGHNLISIVDGGDGFIETDLFGTAASPLDAMLDYRIQHEGVPESPSHALIPSPDSPVIDAGDNTLLFHPEFSGSSCYDVRLSCCPRVRNGVVDIGAIEYQEGSVDDVACFGAHSSDLDKNGRISLSDLLRSIQIYNSPGYHCDTRREDGYELGPGDRDCAPHSADYAPQDWRISLRELLRLIQFYNSGGYYPCPGSEDGFCPGSN